MRAITWLGTFSFIFGSVLMYFLMYASLNEARFSKGSSTSKIANGVPEFSSNTSSNCLVSSRWDKNTSLAYRCSELNSCAADTTSLEVSIVYFARLPLSPSGREIVLHQMEDLRRSGLLSRPRTWLHIALSAEPEEALWFHQTFGFLLTRLRSKISVHVSSKNNYEYEGVHLVWQLACQYPNRLFLYFHNKGLTRSQGSKRTSEELMLFFEIISPWEAILRLFVCTPAQTIGTVASDSGAQWFNFWWARGSYISNLVEPQVDVERHWYEHWLGGVSESGSWCSNASAPRKLPNQGLSFYSYGKMMAFKGTEYSLHSCAFKSYNMNDATSFVNRAYVHFESYMCIRWQQEPT